MKKKSGDRSVSVRQQTSAERDAFKEYRIEAEGTIHRLRAALRAIRGPEDGGPWIEVYRAAGGGYEGLQAIADFALDDKRGDVGGQARPSQSSPDPSSIAVAGREPLNIAARNMQADWE